MTRAHQVVDGVWQITGVRRHLINAYLVDDVLFDAGTRWWHKGLIRFLDGHPIRFLALTHCHPDHQGSAHAVCETYGVPLACHAADVAATEGREPMAPQSRWLGMSHRIMSGPPHPVAEVLAEGDEIGGFQVRHAPGHTPGQVIFFREADRLAIVGDVLNNMNLITGVAGLHEPPACFTVDPEQNRRSLGRLLELHPAIVLCGHGPPLRKPAKLEEFVARLPLPHDRDSV